MEPRPHLGQSLASILHCLHQITLECENHSFLETGNCWFVLEKQTEGVQNRMDPWYNLNACWLQGPNLGFSNKMACVLGQLFDPRAEVQFIHAQVQHQLQKNRHCLAIGTRRSIMGLNSTSLGALGNGIPLETGEANQSVSLQDWTITRRHFQHRFQAIQSCHGRCPAHRFRRPSPCLHPQPAPWDSKKRISITFSCKDKDTIESKVVKSANYMYSANLSINSSKDWKTRAKRPSKNQLAVPSTVTPDRWLVAALLGNQAPGQWLRFAQKEQHLHPQLPRILTHIIGTNHVEIAQKINNNLISKNNEVISRT